MQNFQLLTAFTIPPKLEPVLRFKIFTEEGNFFMVLTFHRTNRFSNHAMLENIATYLELRTRLGSKARITFSCFVGALIDCSLVLPLRSISSKLPDITPKPIHYSITFSMSICQTK